LQGPALWLFLAAIPALADGGPHVAATNSGIGGINADSCAGCHRAHTAQGEYLLKGEGGPSLCLTCHATTGVGATTDVESGQQYTPSGASGVDRGVALGALRAGGFIEARIASDAVRRESYARNATSVSQLAKVPVGNAEPVTSAHLPNTNGTVEIGTGTAWGNGPNSTTAFAGPVVKLSCGTCHNPHGNGQYRILNPIPNGSGATTAASVTDAALPAADDTRNYTVIQTPGPSYLLYASQVEAGGYPATAGDYFHRGVPWDTRTNNDAPNGLPASFNNEISAWCTTCHTRYYSSDDGTNPSGDDVYKYQHNTQSNRACTTCHVSHGSNAQMDGTYASTYAYPDGTTSASSRLLKIDNRGTCQACHDPTGTTLPNTSVGPVPVPYVP